MKPRPNILFFFPDQWRGDWLPGRPDLPLRLPTLERLMERGTTFTRAFTPSPVCTPARVCLATAKDYTECGVPHVMYDMPEGTETFYMRLRQAGYRVGGTGKYDLHKKTPGWGLEGTQRIGQWGFTDGQESGGKWDVARNTREKPLDPYSAALHERGLAATWCEDMIARDSYAATDPSPLPEELYYDSWIGANSVRVIENFPPDQPWFLQINYPGPHEPMDVTPNMHASTAGLSYPPPTEPGDRFDAATHQRIRANYASMCENIDRTMAEMIAAVEKRGELENTIIVFCSDHGEMLGDYGRWAKCLPHDASVHVPLVIAGPGVAAGQRREELVWLQDLCETYLELGGAPGPMEGSVGASLVPLLKGERPSWRDKLTSALPKWSRTIHADEVLYSRPAEELDTTGEW
ncbi:MAG: sulfatase-like hydrolase/transferase [Verrucomicrobiota bacterium]